MILDAVYASIDHDEFEWASFQTLELERLDTPNFKLLRDAILMSLRWDVVEDLRRAIAQQA